MTHGTVVKPGDLLARLENPELETERASLEGELRVREHIGDLLAFIRKRKPGLKVEHVNLFDFVLDYLRSRKLLEKSLENADLRLRIASPQQNCRSSMRSSSFKYSA